MRWWLRVADACAGDGECLRLVGVSTCNQATHRLKGGWRGGGQRAKAIRGEKIHHWQFVPFEEYQVLQAGPALPALSIANIHNIASPLKSSLSRHKVARLQWDLAFSQKGSMDVETKRNHVCKAGLFDNKLTLCWKHDKDFAYIKQLSAGDVDKLAFCVRLLIVEAASEKDVGMALLKEKKDYVGRGTLPTSIKEKGTH
eukprot:1153718-Pelagomonas_calceolata.AAC.1